MLRLTHAIIEEGKSKNGGWSEKQLMLIGVSWPPIKGWKSRSVGREVASRKIIEFLALKDAHLDWSERHTQEV